MAARRIAVTGGTGFIGSHLVRRLVSDGNEVHVLHRPSSNPDRLAELGAAASLAACDLLDAERLAVVLDMVQPEVIYHLAGDTSTRHIDPSLAGVIKSVERNVCTSLNLFVAAHAKCRNLKSLIRLGGLEEYGRCSVPYTEGQREQPVSPYSASQVAITHYLQMLAPHVNYGAITVRPALVYGPGQSTRFFIPALIDHCLRKRDFHMTSGSQGRDLLFVDDLVEALTLLNDHPLSSGEIVNIGAGREYALNDVAAKIVRLTASGIRLLPGAPPRPSEVEHLYCSAEKAGSLLGWHPVVSLDEGLTRTIAWYRQQIDSRTPPGP